MTDYVLFTFKNITMTTNWYCKNTYFDCFATKSMIVVRNRGLTAYVIAFDMALTDKKLRPKKLEKS